MERYNEAAKKPCYNMYEGGDYLASIKEVAQKAIEGFKFYRVCIG